MNSKSLLKALLLTLTSLLLINDSLSIETSSKITSYTNEVSAPERSNLRKIGLSSRNNEGRALEDEMSFNNVGVMAGTLRIIGMLMASPFWILEKLIAESPVVYDITMTQLGEAYQFYSFRQALLSVISGSN